jgi:hypothetical protein
LILPLFCGKRNQLKGFKRGLPSLNAEGKLWVAFPKTASKIVSDLNRDSSWSVLTEKYFETVCEITLDNVGAR